MPREMGVIRARLETENYGKGSGIEKVPAAHGGYRWRPGGAMGRHDQEEHRTVRNLGEWTQ